MKMFIYFNCFIALFVLVSKAECGQVKAECQAILLSYFSTGTHVQQCTVRYDPLTQKQSIYWKIIDCLSWSDAESSCEIAGGSLASFPSVDDKMYMTRFVSPYTSVHNSQNQHCMVPNGDFRNYGVWVGLSRADSSSQEWTWKDGTKEQDDAIPWDSHLGDYVGTDYIHPGNCGYTGWTTACCGGEDWAYDAGYFRDHL